MKKIAIAATVPDEMEHVYKMPNTRFKLSYVACLYSKKVRQCSHLFHIMQGQEKNKNVDRIIMQLL